MSCLMLFNAAPLWAQKLASPNTKNLEEHLLRWPCYERLFPQLLQRWLDESEWKNLDAHLEGRQGVSTRYRVLRGMLAERLGDFDGALAHYSAVAGEDEWARYHRARLEAFTGDIDKAKTELDAIVLATSESYLFKLAATGAAELIMLREDLAAADLYYTNLWESRKELSLRLTLVEPLLSVKTELGTGKVWLDALEPNFPADAGTLPAELVDRGLLWMEGDRLFSVDSGLSRTRIITPSPTSRPYPSSYLRTGLPNPGTVRSPHWYRTLADRGDPSRWIPQFFESPAFVYPENIWELIADGANEAEFADGLYANRLYMDAFSLHSDRPKGDTGTASHDVLMKQVRSIRERLRERPWMAATIFSAIIDANSARETHEVLSTEIFDGIEDPSWRFHSLLLRIQAGDAPEALRADALRLWHDVVPEDVYTLRRDCPDGRIKHARMSERDPAPYYGTPGSRFPGGGVTSPSNKIVWNLRGAVFVDAMRARFPQGLQIAMSSGSSGEISGSFVPLKKIVAAMDKTYDVARFADADTGTTLLRRLWTVRDQLGLGETDLGLPGEKGGDVVDRTVDVLIRSDLKQAREFAKTEAELDSLPNFWLSMLNAEVRRNDVEAKDFESDRRLADEAGNRIEGIIANRHPGWFISRFLGPEPAVEAPSPDPVLLREWLGAYNELLTIFRSATAESSEATRAFDDRWNKVWSRMVPGIEGKGSNSLAVLDARRDLMTAILPHPLWGLEWIPSNSRTRATLSTNYDLPPRDPAFLTDRFPELVKNERHQGMRDIERDPDHVVFRTSVKLVTAYGDEVLYPAAVREAELKPFATRYPFVADLLSIWSTLAKLPPSERDFEGGFSAKELDEVLRTLELSSTTRSRVVLASIYHHYGDRGKSRKLSEELVKVEGPAGTYLDYLNSGVFANAAPATVPALPKSPDSTRETVITRAKSAIKDAAPDKHPKHILRGIFRNDEEKQWLYEWLKTEVKDDPSFARHAGLMAELARVLNLPEADIAAAEEMDRRLNENGADFWMRRREELEKQESDALIEAVKRSDFTSEKGRSAWWNRVSSLQRVFDANRAGDLASAFETAMRQNPPGTAGDTADDIFELVLAGLVDDRRPEDREERIRRLLGVVFEHQRQMFLWNYDSLFELNENLESRGEKELATTLSRFTLRASWSRQTVGEVEQPVFPRSGHRHDLSAWSEQSSDEIRGEAAILPLFDRALRGEGVGEFVDAIVSDARANPKDEFLVTCALMTLAKRGPLPADAVALLEKPAAQAAMRVAWRLCEHAPSENILVAEFVPALERGLTSIFGDKSRYLESGSRHYLLAEKVLPWIERGGGVEAIRRLIPAFVEHSKDLYFPSSWEFVAVTAARWGDAAALAKTAENWKAHCEETLSGRFRTDWTLKTITALTETTAHAGTNGSAFAALSHQVWNRFDEVYGATTDLPADSADRVGAALLASGDHERLAALAASVEFQVRIGGDPLLASVLPRLRNGLALLAEKDPALPVSAVWVDPPSPGGEHPILRWQLSDRPIPDPASAVPVYANRIAGIQVSSLAKSSRFSPPLTALAGRYDIEVLVGPSASGFRPVVKIPLAAATGSMEMPDLPASGWLRSVLRTPDTEKAAFGEATPFAGSAPLLDTSALRKEGAQTDFEGRGDLLGGPADVPEGARLLLRIQNPVSSVDDENPDPASGLQRLTVLGLDENKEVVVRISLAELVMLSPEAFSCPDGSRIVHFKFSQLFDSRRHRDGMFSEEGDTDAARRVRYVAMVGQRSEDSPLPRVRVWALPPDPLQSPPLASVPLLEHEIVVTAGFHYDSWHVSGTIPRAAFSSKGRLSVFDTSAIPWKPVLELIDPRIRSDDRVFVLDEDSLCLSQWAADTEKGCAIFLLRWKDSVPASLDAAVKTELPFDPISGTEGKIIDFTTTEYIVEAQGILLMAGGHARPLRLVWVDSGGKVTSGQIDRPVAKSDGPKLAWWSKDGSFGVWEKNLIHHFQRTPEALVPGEIEEAPFAPEVVPKGAVRGRGLNHSNWVLKRPDLLVRRDGDDGSPLEGYRLKVPCRGVPISLGGESKKVFLYTDGHELISVEPASE